MADKVGAAAAHSLMVDVEGELFAVECLADDAEEVLAPSRRVRARRRLHNPTRACLPNRACSPRRAWRLTIVYGRAERDCSADSARRQERGARRDGRSRHCGALRFNAHMSHNKQKVKVLRDAFKPIITHHSGLAQEPKGEF